MEPIDPRMKQVAIEMYKIVVKYAETLPQVDDNRASAYSIGYAQGLRHGLMVAEKFYELEMKK